MEIGSLADWVTSAAAVSTAIIAGYAARTGLATLRHQRTSFDVQMALGIFESINRYWDRLLADPQHYTYNMGQILAQFEIASALFNNGVLTKTAEPILKDHIVEVFARLISTVEGRETISQCSSSQDTFKELRTFLANHAPTALKAITYSESQPDA